MQSEKKKGSRRRRRKEKKSGKSLQPPLCHSAPFTAGQRLSSGVDRETGGLFPVWE